MHQRKTILWLAVLCACIPAIAILVLHPFFGLMDDWNHLFHLIPLIKTSGLVHATIDYMRFDRSWGMLRLTYPAMVWALYGPAGKNPETLFLLNWLFVTVVVCLEAFAIRLWTKIPMTYTVLGAYAWFHFHDFFLHPSLQEKLVQLIGALLLIAVFSVAKRITPQNLITSAILLALGFASKGSFAIFAGMALAALIVVWALEGLSRKGALVFFTLCAETLAFVIFLKKISAGGYYTQEHFSLHKIIPNISTHTALMLLLLLSSGIFAVILQWRRKSDHKVIAGTFALIVGVAAYLAIFLPWSITGYLETNIAVIAAALGMVALREILPKRETQIVIAVGVAALFCTSYRAITTNLRLHDIGAAVRQTAALTGINEVKMYNAEGADAMQAYWRSQGLSSLRVNFAKDAPKTGDVVFYDNALAPLPNRSLTLPNCKEQVLFASTWKKSFRLVRAENCH